MIIDKCLRCANFCRRSCDYKVGDEILILLDNPTTLDDGGRGPYSIFQVYANGTVTFQRTMHIKEQINIHCIKPFQRYLVKGFPWCGTVSDLAHQYRCI